MNKLEPEHLHLLLDEPFYVLSNEPRQDQHQTQEKTDEIESDTKELPAHKGGNNKGILIIIDGEYTETAAVENEEFLFKGLNALNITLADVAIINSADTSLNTPTHSIRINFSAQGSSNLSYDIEVESDIAILRCHPLEQIRSNKELKIKFWHGLKKLLHN